MRGRNRFLSVKPRKSGLRLEDNSSIAVIGGGPAGSFFSYFMLDMAERMGIKLRADIYEPRNFAADGPAGCNMCGGIISESLVQILAAEGINIPTTVVQHGIDSYIMHTDAGKVRIDTPLHESRIAAVHRGIGPKGVTGGKRESFDAFLLDLAEKKGARVYPHRVEEIRWTGGRPTMIRQDTEDKMYDLLVIATGVNSIFLKKTDTLPFDYIPPETTRTAICEFHLGEEMVNLNLGSSMHVFLLDLPRLEFAAIIPKKDYATVCLMGDKIDSELVNTFLHAPEVRKCFPPDWKPDKIACRCAPSINIEPARNYFGDRVVFIGDTAATRLYKDGIGAAYRTAKAAAMTAVFQGISAEDFRKGYAPECDRIKSDNAAGKRLFSFTGKIQKHKLTKRAIIGMVNSERFLEPSLRVMSGILWDTFTGSAAYKDIRRRMLKPSLFLKYVRSLSRSIFPKREGLYAVLEKKHKQAIGQVFADGDIILRQGEVCDHMFFIQSGRVEFHLVEDERESIIEVLSENDFFNETALFAEKPSRCAAIARGRTQILKIDKKSFLRQLQDDPSMSMRLLQSMSMRIRNFSSLLQSGPRSGV